MKDIKYDDELREAVLGWVRANGLDPNLIPAGAVFTIADEQITTTRWMRSADGRQLFDLDGRTPATETITVPLLVAPEGSVAEWVRPRCPTCGR